MRRRTKGGRGGLRGIVIRILELKDTRDRVAWGVALGTLIGMTPTVGIQMTIAVIFATLLRANRTAAAATVWISNPLTMVPIYWFDYWLGSLILGAFMPLKTLSMEEVSRALFSEGNGFFGALFRFLEGLATLTVRAYPVMFFGGFVMGVALAVPAYFATLWGTSRYHKWRAARKARRRSREAGDEETPNGGRAGGA